MTHDPVVVVNVTKSVSLTRLTEEELMYLESEAALCGPLLRA